MVTSKAQRQACAAASFTHVGCCAALLIVRGTGAGGGGGGCVFESNVTHALLSAGFASEPGPPAGTSCAGAVPACAVAVSLAGFTSLPVPPGTTARSVATVPVTGSAPIGNVAWTVM